MTTDTSHGRLMSPFVTTLSVLMMFVLGGCARLPYTKQILLDDPRLRVTIQQEIEGRGFTHPLELSASDIASILRGYSIREKQQLPLRWFAEEMPPKPLFRSDEIALLAPALADALKKLGPEKRVHFEVLAPGFNPKMRNDVVGGWMAARDPFLYLTVEHFHTQIPTRRSDPYDSNYPTPPPPPKDYLLYFEPGRFFVNDPAGKRALDFRQYLKSAEAAMPVPGSVPTQKPE